MLLSARQRSSRSAHASPTTSALERRSRWCAKCRALSTRRCARLARNRPTRLRQAVMWPRSPSSLRRRARGPLQGPGLLPAARPHAGPPSIPGGPPADQHRRSMRSLRPRLAIRTRPLSSDNSQTCAGARRCHPMAAGIERSAAFVTRDRKSPLCLFRRRSQCTSLVLCRECVRAAPHRCHDRRLPQLHGPRIQRGGPSCIGPEHCLPLVHAR